MIAVIFEVEPRPGAASRYFELAAALKADLESIDGFISVERFESIARPGRFLSLSFWRDEDGCAVGAAMECIARPSAKAAARSWPPTDCGLRR